MGRGPVRLSDAQVAKLAVARQRRVEYDNARAEWAVRVARLRDEFFGERDSALVAAVHECLGAGVPMAHVKRALNMSDHRTFKSRFVDTFVAPTVVGWDFERVDDFVVLSRFLDFRVNLVFGLVDGVVVVEPKDSPEFDEAGLADVLLGGGFVDEWGVLMAEIGDALNVANG